MRVFLTGASGYIGSHTVRALLDAGHTVRALARDPDKASSVLAKLDVPSDVPSGAVELVRGDMLDAGTVDGALAGCDAAIHAAAAIGVTRPGHGRGATGDPERDLVHVNVTGTRNVIGGAVAQGIDRIVYVSTIGVFVPPSAPVITADGPLATPHTDYGRSKVAAERYVRDLQAENAPVTIVYPGGVGGPAQPVLDSLMEGLARGLDLAFPLPPGGVSIIDVRDLAEALTRAVSAPAPVPDRMVLGGHYLTWRRYAALCDRLTGVRSRSFPVPAGVLLGAGSLLDAAKRVRHFDYPLTRDAAEYMVTMVPTDDAPALEALSMTLRPVEETLEDSLRWLAGNGHLRRAGRLAPSRPVRDTPLRRVAVPPVARMAGARWFTPFGSRVVPPLDRFLHRVSGGRFLIGQALIPSMMLTTTGAVSGLPRRTPLACLPEPGGGWVVVGSNFGRENHPAWTANLLKHPEAEVGFRGRTVPVTARLLEGRERDEVWPRVLQVWPVYERYRERTRRELRVFRLTPRT